MALSETTRLGLTRWSGGNDPFNRDQMDDGFERLEARAGLFYQGTLAARPAAAAAYARGFYLATDQNAPYGILYYCDGSSWTAVNSYAAPTGQAPGDAITEGTAITHARSDHKHSLPAWGVVGEVATVGTAAAAGVLAKFARVDHAHILADGAVIANKIAAGGVSASNQIANGIIVAGHLAAGSVGAAAISEDQRLPIGSIIMYTGLTTPVGWLMCDGTSYATATYPGLFTTIGYKYGGSGANFNVPDFRDRLPRGAATPSSAAAVGVQAGSDTAALTSPNQLPSHTHGASGLTSSGIGNHNHTWGNWSGGANADHYHGFSGTTSYGGGHIHSGNSTGNASFMKRLSSYSFAMDGLQYVGAGAGLAIRWDTDTLAGGDHSHTYSGNTGGRSADHAHYTSGTTSDAGGWTPTISGNTAATGAGASFSVIPKSLTVNFLIKI